VIVEDSDGWWCVTHRNFLHVSIPQLDYGKVTDPRRVLGTRRISPVQMMGQTRSRRIQTGQPMTVPGALFRQPRRAEGRCGVSDGHRSVVHRKLPGKERYPVGR
jgi:hypothetical protein